MTIIQFIQTSVSPLTTYCLPWILLFLKKIFKWENIQLLKTTKKKIISSLIWSRLNMKNIQSKEVLEYIIQSFANYIEWIWYKHLRVVNITKHSKEWWIIAEIWSFIDKPGGLMIGNNSRVWSRRQNTIFLI